MERHLGDDIEGLLAGGEEAFEHVFAKMMSYLPEVDVWPRRRNTEYAQRIADAFADDWGELFPRARALADLVWAIAETQPGTYGRYEGAMEEGIYAEPQARIDRALADLEGEHLALATRLRGDLLAQEGKFEDAERVRTELLEIASAIDTRHRLVAYAHGHRAYARYQLERDAEAIDDAKRAIDIFREHDEPLFPHLLNAHRDLAQAREGLEAWNEARDSWQTLIDEWTEAYPDRDGLANMDCCEARLGLARCARGVGDVDTAKALVKDVKAQAEFRPGPFAPIRGAIDELLEQLGLE